MSETEGGSECADWTDVKQGMGQWLVFEDMMMIRIV